MKKVLTPEERLERLRLLGERHELERLDVKTPSQLGRLAELNRILETGRPSEKSEHRPKTKLGPAVA